MNAVLSAAFLDELEKIAEDIFPAIADAASRKKKLRLKYNGVTRTVEPYSLRTTSAGNRVLYVYETRRGRKGVGGIKALKLDGISDARVINRNFKPRYPVELGKEPQ